MTPRLQAHEGKKIIGSAFILFVSQILPTCCILVFFNLQLSMPISCQKYPRQSSLPLFSLIPRTALAVTIFARNILQSDHLLLCQCNNNLFLFLISNSILIPNYFLLFPSRSIWTAAAGLWTWVTHPAFQSSIPILSLY